MSIADKYRPRFTYDDYQSWEGRWELIEGMPYAMSPAPAPGHQDINLNLAIVFKAALKQSCDQCKTYIPIDWKINELTVVQPDLLIVCKEIEKKFLDFTPSLVIEILSPATAYKDRHEKFELYQQEKVPYYLIVDPQFKKIAIYELNNGNYELTDMTPPNAAFILSDGYRFSVDLENIWE
jgi:Uma2 family endonuclease